MLALSRSAYPDLVWLAGELLSDPEPPVRRAAAALEALGVRRYEADVVERARARAEEHGRLDLFEGAFGERS